jgi:ADP-ribosylglycohydrolase
LTQISANNNEHFIDDSIRGAIWGQFVGDAFCLGSHWIYDLEELAQRFPGGPQGFDAPAKGHYHFGKSPGDLTHYGDGAMVLLRSLAEQGRFDAVDFGSRFVALFDSTNYSGYRDHATKETIANMHAFMDAHPDEVFLFQSGADDDQPATVSRMAPLAAFHYHDDDYLSVVERVTLVCQNNRRAVAYAQAHALILRELFLGSPLHDAILSASNVMLALGRAGTEVSEVMNEAMAAGHQDVTEAILHFGQSCPLKSSFPAALQCALHHGEDFAGALRANAAAGGDSAGRAAMIGAWLGAAYGVEVIPRSWQELLTAQKEISAGVELIVMTP